MKSLAGMSINEFHLLVSIFDLIVYENKASRHRERAVRNGQKGALADFGTRKYFLYYYI